MADDATRSGVGSVAEETARLLDALLGDARDGSGAAAAQTRRPDSPPDADACPTCGHVSGPSHTAASPEVCRVCPVCQLLRVVRAVQPETLDRLADLAGAVTEALRDAAASRWRETGAGAPTASRPTVEDIDVTDMDSGEGAR